MDVIDLFREKANRREFEFRIEALSPQLVVLNGHGSELTVAGHNNLPIVTCGENEGLLKSKIVYAISCKSAKTLGPKSVKAGAKNYAGYDDDFIFFYSPTSISRPLQDATAKLFLDHSNVFVTSLIKGNTVSAAYEKSRAVLKRNLAKTLSEKEQTPLARYLWWNLQHFVAHGDGESAL